MIVQNAPQKAKKSKKQRKHGRGKRAGGQCTVYKLQHRRERNKIRRLVKHLVRHPADKAAEEVLKHYKTICGVK